MLNKKIFKGLLTVGALSVLAPAMAARNPAANAPAPAASSRQTYEPTTSAGVTFGVGMQRLVTGVNNTALNQMHAEVVLGDRWHVGAGFGFSSGFDELAVGADGRYDLVKRGNHAFFTKVTASFVRISGNESIASSNNNQGVGTQGGFAAGLLAGLDFGVSEQLHVSVAYGLQLLFASDVANHVGFTNNDAVGNFGVHWYF